MMVQTAVRQQRRRAVQRQRRWLWRHSPILFQLGADVLSVAAATGLYLWVRFGSGWFDAVVYPGAAEVLAIVGMLTLYWLLLFWLFGLYQNWYVRPPLEELGAVLRITFVGMLVLLLLVWGDSGEFYRKNFRAVGAIYWGMLLLGVSAGRLLVRALQRWLRRRGIVRIPVLLVGTDAGLERLRQELQRIPHWGYSPVGTVRLELADGSAAIEPVQQWMERAQPEEALVAIHPPQPQQLWAIVGMAVQRGIAVKILPDSYSVFMGQARIQRLYGTDFLEVEPRLLKPWQALLKRAIDIAVSVVVLVGGAPLWALIALLIRLDSPGPVLFVQERVGKDGRRFRLYKFRTMVADAEQRARWTQLNDPRVTRLGRWLRRTYLDEILQFWNVLRGEMSIVGPRPEIPYFVERFTQMVPEYARRHVVKPGITGWWQVCRTNRDDAPTEEEVRRRLAMDFYYIENQSLALDLEIMLRTLWRMLRGKGKS